MKNRVYLLLDDKLFKLKELYFCVICSKIKSDYNLKKEIEYYYCNGCTQIYTKNETALYSYECLRCFKCPFCFSCLSIAHKNLENSTLDLSFFKLINNEMKDNYTEKESKECKVDFKNLKSCKSDQEGIDEFYDENISNTDYTNRIENNSKCEFITDEEHNLKNKLMMNKQNELLKKDKKVFYFKCQYCLWSSIYSICNTKLDELIGDMIIFEKKCVFRCNFRNILNEIKKSNDLLKQRKIFKRIDLYSSSYKLENFNSSNNWDYTKLNESKSEKKKEEFLKDNLSLICKANIHIDKVSLKDILNDEHIKNDQDFNDIFELENEKIKYLDLALLQSQTNLKGIEKSEKTDDNEKSSKEKSDDNTNYNKEENKNNIEKDDINNVSETYYNNHNIEKNYNNNDNNNNNSSDNNNNGNGNTDNNNNDNNNNDNSNNTNNYVNNIEENIEEREKKEISSFKNNKLSNVIINSKNYLSFEHICNYPYNFYKGLNELKPLRKKLLAKKSKRCSKCKQYLLKFHSSNLYSTFRLNNNALKYIPRIYINDFRIIKKKNGILNFVLINPLDLEMNVKIIPQMEHNFLKNININKIPINCESKANSFEFIMDTYDEIIDDLSKDEKDIKTVLTSENIIIKKQNNMALIIISFIYNDDLNKSTVENNSSMLYEQREHYMDESINLNFPLILECSFSDKLKKEHKITLNLVFTNNIDTKRFHNYLLNS